MRERSPDRNALALAALPVAFFLLLLAPSLSPHYGFYSDELYYLACARRLAFGYVDHPPLFPLLLRAHEMLFGDSLLALRVLPAALGAFTAFVASWMARRLGGARLAQCLAALAVMGSPQLQIWFSWFSVNSLEVPLWTAACGILLERCRSGEPRLWIALGVVLGASLLTKHTTVLFMAALGVATVLGPLRRDLRTPWPWLGALAAVLLVLPNVYWQWAHGWPSLDFYRSLGESNIPTSAPAQLVRQVWAHSPANFPLWASGAFFFLASRRARRFRPLGWLFLTLLAFALFGGQSRADRIAGVYPLAFAGGAVCLEALGRRSASRLLALSISRGLPGLVIAGGLVGATLVLPILPPDWLAHHPLYDAQRGGGWRPEVGRNRIPYLLGNRTHWEAFVETVAQVYEGLDPPLREEAIVLADYFGHAGALEYYGRERELPPVYSPMTGYFLWGPPEGSPQTVIAIGIDPAFLENRFAQVETAAVFRCDDCPRVVDELPIRIARFPQRSWSQLWPEIGRLESRRTRMLRAQEAERAADAPASRFGSGGRRRAGVP